MRAILGPRVNRHGLTVARTSVVVLLLTTSLLPMAVLKAQQAPPDNGGSAQSGRNNRAGMASPPATRPDGFGRGGIGGGRSGGLGEFGGAGAMLAAAPVLGEGPTCTFDTTIYDVRLPVDQIGRLDLDALAKTAESVEVFEKALAGLGAAKPMYRAIQSVRLAGDSMTISSKVPMISGSQRTPYGQMIHSYRFESLGAQFSIAGKAGGPGASELDLSIQVSSTSDVAAPVAEIVHNPLLRTATLLHKGPFQPRKPFVVVSVDAGSLDQDGKAVAYIARVTMGEPELRGER